MKTIVVVLAFIAFVSCQNWLNSPQPAGWVAIDDPAPASMIAPCGNPNITVFAVPPTFVMNYGYLNVSFSISGQNGNGYCRFAVSEHSDDGTEFDQNVFYTRRCNTGLNEMIIPAWYDKLQNTTEELFVQFTFYADDGSIWYNCGKILVEPTVDVITVQPGASVEGFVDGMETDHFKGLFMRNEHYFLQASGVETGMVTLLATEGQLATNETHDVSIMLNAGQQIGFTFCTRVDLNSTLFISYSGYDNDTMGTYRFSSTSYNAEIDFLAAKPQITDNLAVAGSKFYYTLAYSTEEKPKKIVVNAVGNVRIRQSLDMCEQGTVFEASGSGTLCAKLSTINAKKYIEVNSDAAASYTISVEEGKCEEQTGAASHFGVSIMSIALLISMLMF